MAKHSNILMLRYNKQNVLIIDNQIKHQYKDKNMPLSDEKKYETRDRINRDPDFRNAFLMQARNMYKKALQFDAQLEEEINRFEQILGAEPDTYEFMEGELDEIDIFENILDAYDSQMLEEEKDNSTIN